MFVTKFCLKRDFDYDSLDLKMMNNRRDIYRCQKKDLITPILCHNRRVSNGNHKKSNMQCWDICNSFNLSQKSWSYFVPQSTQPQVAKKSKYIIKSNLKIIGTRRCWRKARRSPAKAAMTPKTTMEGYDYISWSWWWWWWWRLCWWWWWWLHWLDADDVLMVSFQETEDNYEEINLKRGDGLKREDISEVWYYHYKNNYIWFFILNFVWHQYIMILW